jgi:hypothetical protein
VDQLRDQRSAISDQRGQPGQQGPGPGPGPRIGTRARRPPVAPPEPSGYGLWVHGRGRAGASWMWSGGSNLAAGPLGSVAGDPDRHRGLAPLSSLLCPSPVPAAAAGRGLRPRVFSAHGPGRPQLQAPSTCCPGKGCNSPSSGSTFSDRTSLPFRHMPISIIWPDHVPIQTHWRSRRRKPGPRIALPAHRLYYPIDMWPPVDHTGLLRRSARCVLRDHTARAHAATAVLSQRPPPFLHVRPRGLFVARVRASREQKTASPIPAESHVAVCMPAARKEAI